MQNGARPGRFRAKIDLMKTPSNKKRGLYVSYNEGKNGAFDEAIQISNEFGCVTWIDRSPLNPKQLHCPTDIFVRLTGQERYFRGILLAVASADTLNPDFALGEHNHRPSAWRERDKNVCPRPNKDFKSVLFINSLREMIRKPLEVGNRRPPQSPVYVEL